MWSCGWKSGGLSLEGTWKSQVALNNNSKKLRVFNNFSRIFQPGINGDIPGFKQLNPGSALGQLLPFPVRELINKSINCAGSTAGK